MMHPRSASAPSAQALAQLRARVDDAHASAADWLALGRALWQAAGRDRERQREALHALVHAWQLDPTADADLLRTIAQTAFIVHEWPIVESATNVLLKRDARDGNALIWRAAALQHHGDFEGAEKLLRNAARLLPNNPVALHKLALCVKEQARYAEAETLLRRVLTLTPGSPHALVDLAELQIRSGRFREGWAHYESRVAFTDEPNESQQALASISRYWQGESLAGKTLIVYGEQGNGDCLWAYRFLPQLAERARREGGRVIFGHDGPLHELFERALPPALRSADALDAPPDFHCGLMSLPLRLSIDAPAGWGRPYLQADTQRAAVWRKRVMQSATPGACKVGLVWDGSDQHVRDGRRAVPTGQLEPMLLTPGVTWYTVSPGRGQRVTKWRGKSIDMVDLTTHYETGFDDVAALLVNLDLVVTVDSGPAHLAGALGVPTCLMIDHVSAWFWGNRLRRTPWYDSIELFRQPALGDWAPVLAGVRERLEALVSGGQG